MFHGHSENARPTTISGGSHNKILARVEADMFYSLAGRRVRRLSTVRPAQSFFIHPRKMA
jgi:hypothetical protein